MTTNARFAARLEASRRAARRALAAAGRLRDDARDDDPPLEMPQGFARVLAAAIDEENRAGTGRAEALERHYLELMPRLRAEQLDVRDGPAARFFDAPLRWERLRRLSAACARLGVPMRDVTVGAFYAGTCYGGFMPLLYAYPADLASYDDGGDIDAAIDRHLAAPLVHELAHGARDRTLLSLYLDECLAGWLGTRALAGDNDLFAAPWLAQVGQALARVVGAERLRAAHAGATPWEAVLPPGLPDAIRARAWQDYLATRPLHLLSDATAPDPWMKLFFLAAAGAPLDPAIAWREVPPGAEDDAADAEILDDALAAMCLRNFQVARSFRVAKRPPPAPVDVDLDACRVSTAAGADGFDPAPPAYLFPPAIAARLRARGIAGYTVEIETLAALGPLARALADGAPSRRGDGFTLTRR
jgi:hypothetical protein